jgi:GNAT superfamily N-acetyltransferase
MSESLRIAVRPPNFSDWPALLALLQAAFADMDGRIDPPSSLARLDVDALRAKAAYEHLIVATVGNTLVGCAFAAIRDDCVYVGKLAVAAAARRRGVARALIDAAARLARDHGRTALELQTRIELTENHATFAALGFAKVAETAHPGYARPTSITLRRPAV